MSGANERMPAPSAVEKILDRLEKVRARGHGRWMACCPAHADRTPSLSVREESDGRVLIHCFGQQCAPTDVLAAIGLRLSDLFPDGLAPRKGRRPRWNHRELLEVVAHEAMVVAVAAGRVVLLTDEEVARVQLAAERINKVLEIANVR